MEELKINSNEALILLIGNKKDLLGNEEKNRMVPFNLANNFALEKNLIFAETSALNFEDVEKIFSMFIEGLLSLFNLINNFN